jgi:branched-chain amino acid transport system ATP-binding protein
MNKSMLRIENLSVNYGHISALKGVSLNVNQGEIVTLIGGNGAGKTTTLMSVSNLTDKADGSVIFKDTNITRIPPDRIVKMGISHVPEGRKIFPALTVYENLIAGTLGNPHLTKDEIGRNLEDTYKMFPRLKERTAQSGGSLSGGEQQMLPLPAAS